MSEIERLKRLENIARHQIQFILDKEAFAQWDSKISLEDQLKKENEHIEAFKKFLKEE